MHRRWLFSFSYGQRPSSSVAARAGSFGRPCTFRSRLARPASPGCLALRMGPMCTSTGNVHRPQWTRNKQPIACAGPHHARHSHPRPGWHGTPFIPWQMCALVMHPCRDLGVAGCIAPRPCTAQCCPGKQGRGGRQDCITARVPRKFLPLPVWRVEAVHSLMSKEAERGGRAGGCNL